MRTEMEEQEDVRDPLSPEPPSPLSPERRDWRVTLAGVAGNALELYDFAVYGAFSDVIGKVFFPPQEGNVALVQSFLVFGVAFVARPLGGAAFGYLGDTVGRKSALENSILLMAFPTIAIGCLPSFAAAGWLALVLLVLCRILQGMSVGGQLMSSMVFTLEVSPENEWGRQTAKVLSATLFGTLVGSLVSFALRMALDEDQLLAWGWRLPFFIGVLGILPEWYLKRLPAVERLAPPPPLLPPQGAREELPNTKRQNVLAEVFGAVNFRAMVASMLVPSFSAGGYYIVFVWLPIYMESIVKVPYAFGISSAIGVLSLGLIFASGWLTDKIDSRVPQMLLSSLACGIMAPIFIGLIGNNGNPVVCFFLQGSMALILMCFHSALIPWLIANFSPHVRLTSVSISYNVSVSLVGGFAPAIATVLAGRYGNVSPGYIITGLAVLTWIGLGVGATGGGNKEAVLPENVSNTLSSIV